MALHGHGAEARRHNSSVWFLSMTLCFRLVDQTMSWHWLALLGFLFSLILLMLAQTINLAHLPYDRIET